MIGMFLSCSVIIIFFLSLFCHVSVVVYMCACCLCNVCAMLLCVCLSARVVHCCVSNCSCLFFGFTGAHELSVVVFLRLVCCIAVVV